MVVQLGLLLEGGGGVVRELGKVCDASVMALDWLERDSCGTDWAGLNRFNDQQYDGKRGHANLRSARWGCMQAKSVFVTINKWAGNG